VGGAAVPGWRGLRDGKIGDKVDILNLKKLIFFSLNEFNITVQNERKFSK